MIVRFIAHAGIYIQEGEHSVLIDPWFLDSTIENPVIESIAGGFKTIDFQIPKTPEHIENYAPDAILVSHFHPHHSPARDINILCKNSLAKGKTVRLLYPLGTEEMEQSIRSSVPEAEKVACTPGSEMSVGPFTLRALEHTVQYHSAWQVVSPTGSVVHIGDGRLNKDWRVRLPDAAWMKLENLAPTFLFLSSGGHSLRGEKDGRRYIQSAGIFSPVEAATITRIIAPAAVAVIGIYNHSIWKNRIEYIQPTAQCEEEFQWAISWLAPNIRNVRLIPGMTLGAGDETVRGKCSVYIP